jgi:REP element-mobilizing transposase RayT
MPRQRRIECSGAIYHAMARGDRREDIVLDDSDRKRFEETLAEVVERSGWVVYAWVLMSNHYQLLFPALRSGPTAASGASRQKQISGSQRACLCTA